MSEALIAKTRPSVQKRQNEAAKLEKAQIKAARKARRKAEAAEATSDPGVHGDPDLLGIVAGPQPVPDEEEEDFAGR